MYDIAVVYQSHREGHPNMVDQMWVTSWHHYLDSHGVSRGMSFATEEEAVTHAHALCRIGEGYTIKGVDGVTRYVAAYGVEEEYCPF